MTWLRASRTVRILICDIAGAVAAVAGAGAACGVCRAVWLLISFNLDKAGK